MGRRTAPLFLVSVLSVAGSTHAASSADGDQALPLTVQVPYGFLFLHLPGFSADPPERWSYDVSTTVTNNFIYSDNFGEMLGARTARTPITEADIEAVAAASPGEDYYYFDGEVMTLNAMIRTPITPTFAVAARFSAVGITGGEGMDGFVEGFHDTFGLGQAYRDNVTRGSITAAVRIDGHDETIVDYDRMGLGDPIAYALWAPEWGARSWRTSFAAGLKIPIGSTSKRLSTGRADAGVAFAVTGDVGRWRVNVNGGVIVPGSISFLPGLDTAPFAGVAASAGYRFQTTSLWVQVNWEQSPFRDATQTPLSDDVHDVSLGVRFPLGGSVRGYVAFTENVFAFDNSSDIGFHGGITWRTQAD